MMPSGRAGFSMSAERALDNLVEMLFGESHREQVVNALRHDGRYLLSDRPTMNDHTVSTHLGRPGSRFRPSRMATEPTPPLHPTTRNELVSAGSPTLIVNRSNNVSHAVGGGQRQGGRFGPGGFWRACGRGYAHHRPGMRRNIRRGSASRAICRIFPTAAHRRCHRSRSSLP
jgi:hypothetical protein